jgi:hypothetical protein
VQSQFQFSVSNSPPANPDNGISTEIASLLKQILDVQKEQLTQLRSTAAAPDGNARWKALLARWRADFPDLPATCKQVLPTLERALGSIIATMVDELRNNGDDALDNEFSLQDFIDRYGMRLGQLGNILNLVTPLAEAGAQKEAEGSK